MRKYKPVEARTVAAAMRAAIRQGKPGAHCYENKDLPELAGSL